MNLTNFKIKTAKGISVLGDIEGKETSRRMVIFSHGFGVTRDSHGMFTQLSEMIKETSLVVRFDYTVVNKEERWSRVYPYHVQKEMLESVYAIFVEKYKPTHIQIVGHSMGCLITAMADLPKLTRTILLAGPPTSPYKRMKSYFLKRKETKIDEGGESVIKRSDGSVTYVGPDFWPEMRQVKPIELYKQLSTRTILYFIKAVSDQVITETDYNELQNCKKIIYKELPGNHDFEDNARLLMLNTVSSLLNK